MGKETFQTGPLSGVYQANKSSMIGTGSTFPSNLTQQSLATAAIANKASGLFGSVGSNFGGGFNKRADEKPLENVSLEDRQKQ